MSAKPEPVGTPGGVVTPTAAPPAVGVLRCLLVSVAWSDEAVNPWALSDAQAMADRCRDWYAKGSYGKVDLQFTVAPFVRNSLPNSNGVLDFSQRGAGLDPQLTALGFPPQQYDRQIYLTTRAQSRGFKGSCWGRGMWVNCMQSGYADHSLRHEFGHSLGLAHPMRLNGLGTRVGNVYTIPSLDVVDSGQAKGVDLYDVSTTMGYEASGAQFSGPEKSALGWITPAVYVGGDQTYTLTPLSDQGGGLYAVKIAMTAFRASSHRVYWVENRTDTIGENGVQIRLDNDFGCFSHGHIGGAFPVGDTFTDGTIAIEVVADGVVRIKPAASVVVVPPIVPPLVPPSPPVARNTQMLIDGIKTKAATVQAAANGLALGQVTQAVQAALLASVDALKTDVALLVPDVVAGPLPPPPSTTGASPAGTTATPGAGSIVDDKGATWTLLSSPLGELRRDGASASWYASQILWTGTRLEAKHKDSGNWWYWDGARWQWTGR